MYWTVSFRVNNSVHVVQVALTVGTVVFGIYVATKIWSKQDPQGGRCCLWRNTVCYKTNFFESLTTLSFVSQVQLVVIVAAACSPPKEDSHANRMMMDCLTYGLKVNQNAKLQESHRMILSGSPV